MKSLILIIFLSLSYYISFGQNEERKLSDYEKYRIEKEKEQNSYNKKDTVFIQVQNPTIIVNQYPEYSYRYFLCNFYYPIYRYEYFNYSNYWHSYYSYRYFYPYHYLYYRPYSYSYSYNRYYRTNYHMSSYYRIPERSNYNRVYTTRNTPYRTNNYVRSNQSRSTNNYVRPSQPQNTRNTYSRSYSTGRSSYNYNNSRSTTYRRSSSTQTKR